MPETSESNPEDYLIRVRPGLTSSSSWDGAVSIDIMWSPKNPLPDADFDQLLHLSKLMCASVPVMESDDVISHILEEYVGMVYTDEEEEEGVVTTSNVCSIEGNVIKVNFKGVPDD